MKKLTDKHHITKDKTTEIDHKLHQKIHGTEPIISVLNLKMRQYDKLVKLSVMLKNWTWIFGIRPLLVCNRTVKEIGAV